MAHYAEIARPPPVDFGAMWGLGRKPDHTKWQWEAPSTPSAPQAAITKPLLPTWLTEFEAPEILNTDTDALGQPESLRHVQDFCESLRQAPNLYEITDLCADFNLAFGQSVRLGQVSDDVLAISIRDVTNYIRQRVGEQGKADTLCLTFLRAVWDGITESKVVRPTDVSQNVLHWFLIRMQQLPLQTGAPLFTEVLNSINGEQKAQLRQALFSVANGTFGPGMGGSAPPTQMFRPTPAMKLASLNDEGLLSVDFLEGFVQSLGHSLASHPSPKAIEHVRDLARLSTSYVALSIHRHCASVSQKIKSGATGIDPQWARIRLIRKSWLKLISQLPYATESLLAEACRIMEAGDPSSDFVVRSDLSIRDLCDVTLEFWSSGLQGESISAIKASFEAAMNKPGSKEGSKGAIVHLVRALELHSKHWRKMTGDFFRVLRSIRGASLSTFHCLRDLEKAGLCLRVTTLRKEVNELAEAYPAEARVLCDMYASRQRDALGLEYFPEVANAIIEGGSPDEIWQAMGGNNMWQERSISEVRIDLVRRIALRFAQAEGISSRVALRNLTRCYHYLSYHKVDIPAEISQLITKVGLERNILEKGAISNGRLDWILGIVANAEGVRKADLIDEVLHRRKEMERNRHRDPLRRGPIG